LQAAQGGTSHSLTLPQRVAAQHWQVRDEPTTFGTVNLPTSDLKEAKRPGDIRMLLSSAGECGGPETVASYTLGKKERVGRNRQLGFEKNKNDKNDKKTRTISPVQSKLS
jgi:hypothetical protein